jgi:uncharacterized tellurite resistance protein B-like protein
MRLGSLFQRWFSPLTSPAGTGASAVHKAAAALLAQLAMEDGTVDPAEVARMCAIAAREFNLEPAAAEQLVNHSLEQARHSVDLFQQVRTLVAGIEHQDRTRLVELLWEVVYSDGAAHDREMNFMRRVAGLLYVTDQDSGSARKRVLARQGG